jgi:hypothetical protein
MFLLTVGFQSERGKALLSETRLTFLVKSDAENDMETRFLITSNGGSSLRGDKRNLLGDL